MKELPLISVIVPVYGVENYLDKCVASIVNQTYENLEIILVDDGSPDNCGALCDAWAARDGRIKVIHKENGGLSDARNAGMAIAAGELMGFIDSDDWIEPEMFWLLYERLTADHSDIAACGMELFFENGEPARMFTVPGCCVMDTVQAMRAFLEEKWLKQPVCNRLYKTALIRDIPFPVGQLHEDTYWSYRALARAARVSVFDTPCYHYLQRGGSIMGTAYSLKRLEVMETKKQMLAFLSEHFPALEYEGKVNLFFFCVYSMQMSLLHLTGTDLETAKAIIRKTVSEIKPLPPSRKLPLKKNIWLILAQISFEGVCKLQNFLEGKL